MWTHLIQLMRARRALRAGRFEAALSALEDPMVRDDRRAQDMRAKVVQRMLARARRRLDGGHLSLARRDLDRLQVLEPELPGSDDLASRLAELDAQAEEQHEDRERFVASFELALDQGRLAEAREMLKRAALENGERKRFAERLNERRLAASRALKQVREAIDRGLQGQAREALKRARRLCSDSITFRERLVGLSAAWAKERWQEVQSALKDGRPLDAAKALAEWWKNDPESENLSEARDLLLCVADRLATEVRRLATAGDFEEAVMLACQAPGPVGEVGVLRRLRDCLEHLDSLLRADDTDPRRRVQGLTRLQAETRWSSIEPRLAALRREAQAVDHGLAEARELLTKGRTAKGKERLEKILDRWPGCDEAKALLTGLIDDERQRAERLDAARQAMREGRLLEAQRHLLGIVSGGYGADEARNLLRDVERLRAKVTRELASQEARLDAGSGPEEILSCLQRLRQTQNDSPELDDLEGRVLHRQARVEREARIRKALARRDSRACLAALREWIADGGEGGLRDDEKKELSSIGEELYAGLTQELANGDPSFVAELGTGLRTWEDLLGVDLTELLEEAGDRIDEARRLAREGVELLDKKHVEEAERLLELAREICPSEPQVLRLAHRIRRLERDRKEVEAAISLVETDRDGAREKLSGLGPTQRPLGSLVLQLKDKLERSGDLESGCRLQVEEVGEFLLFAEDRLRVGNATGKHFPHLPVLSKIRGHHATFERTVSFHGGVKDRIIVQEGAEMKVNGRKVDEASLSHGDRIVLGGVLPFVYQRPSPRSSTALLRIERGFECRGVTRVLWIQQGGKEGRIFFGRGKDVHVRVPIAELELYLYAPRPGRLAVHFDGTGEIDGREFTGDCEVRPGSHVKCGAIAFRVLPL